jgi:heme A synthase
MRYELRLHRLLLSTLVGLLVLFVVVLFYLDARADRVHFEAIASLIVVI